MALSFGHGFLKAYLKVLLMIRFAHYLCLFKQLLVKLIDPLLIFSFLLDHFSAKFDTS